MLHWAWRCAGDQWLSRAPAVHLWLVASLWGKAKPSPSGDQRQTAISDESMDFQAALEQSKDGSPTVPLYEGVGMGESVQPSGHMPLGDGDCLACGQSFPLGKLER